jgi:predicted sulfurtransferase
MGTGMAKDEKVTEEQKSEEQKEDQKDEQTIEKLCDNCGQDFSAFLHQMEEQNAKVVCTTCGKEHELPPAETSRTPKEH